MSCYGWEKYINNEVINLLSEFGALGILEFKNILETDYSDPLYLNWQNLNKNFNYNNKLNINNQLVSYRPYHHPYAFIGIRNLKPGMGFESIRTNKANLMSNKNIPTADIRVRLKYETYNMNYFFDKKILGENKLNYIDSYDLLWNATDYSLLNLLPLYEYTNQNRGYNYLFSIYDHNVDLDKQQSNHTTFLSAFDYITLGDSPAKRLTYKGLVYQEGEELNKKKYYNFYKVVIEDKKLCPPPFNNTDLPECPGGDVLQERIPILRCRTGIAPQLCKDNEVIFNKFDGFK